MAERERIAAQTMTCEECKRPWSDPAERWRLYLSCDEPTVPIAYCRSCSEREFGEETSPAE